MLSTYMIELMPVIRTASRPIHPASVYRMRNVADHTVNGQPYLRRLGLHINCVRRGLREWKFDHIRA